MPKVETLWLCAAVNASPINFAVMAHNPQHSTASNAHSNHAGSRIPVEPRAVTADAPAFDRAPGEPTPARTQRQILASQIGFLLRSFALLSQIAAPPTSL